MATGVFGGACVENHTAYITDRGGKGRAVQLLDLSRVQWDRRRDETSESLIVIQGGACAKQAEALSNIEPKRNELVLFRGQERVWEGPVMRVGWYDDRVEIAAHDIMEYVNARPLSKEWTSAHPATTTATGRIAEIMNFEMANPFTYLADDGVTTVTVPGWEELDPPANVLPHFVAHASVNEAETSATTRPFQMSVGQHLDNMARTGGLDYTVVGRALHVWDVSRALGRTRTLTEADFFGPVIITAYGADHASIAFTVAQDGRYGGAGQNNDYYGPWAKIFTVYDEDETNPPTQADLNSQARRNLSGRTPVPIEVRVPDNSRLRLTSDLTIDMLVPGVQIPLLATLNSRTTSQLQKLHRVVVREDANEESVQVTLVPATRPDSDEEEGI